MFSVTIILGLTAGLIAIISYLFYLREFLIKKRTKPHAYTWLIWSILTGIGFVTQVLYNAGIASIALGLTSLLTGIICIAAFYKGEKDIRPVDTASLIGAGVALLFWILTSDPTTTLFLLILIDALGFVPTFRKAYAHPLQETATTHLMSVVKYILVLVALESYSIYTYLYPAYLTLINSSLVTYLLFRRTFLAKYKPE